MKNTGGSAFPDYERFELLRRADLEPEYKEIIYTASRGMTLRDYFAAKADNSGECPCNQYDHTECAEWAFARADAMLEARKK